MEKRCQNCHQVFLCGQGNGCWCQDAIFGTAQLSWIKENLVDCLCPTCLSMVSSGPPDFSLGRSVEKPPLQQW